MHTRKSLVLAAAVVASRRAVSAIENLIELVRLEVALEKELLHF